MVGPGGPLGVELVDGDLRIQALGLWLDPTRRDRGGELRFVSHAHGSIARLPPPHDGRCLTSAETLALWRAALSPPRTAVVEASPGLSWNEVTTLPIDPEHGGGVAHLTIVPAGHVLGAAQLVVDHPGGRLVYTGDWNGDDDPTRARGRVVRCDELVVNAAFALPIFRFPPMRHALTDIGAWCADQLGLGMTPVVLAGSPGPAQSVVHALVEGSIPVAASPRVLRDCAVYAAYGVACAGILAAPTTEMRALVASADARRRDLASMGATRRVSLAYASGWAVLDGAVAAKQADAAFALADCADYDQLMSLVLATGARRVDVTRGEARPFARALCDRGLTARCLDLPAIDERRAS